jgi:HAD superfamily hydrolase (TIGR01458 family)
VKPIKGILSDIDGTLYFKGAPVPGTIEAVEVLREKGIKLLFFTNTDSKTPKNVYKSLIEYGFKVKEEEIFTPIIALKEFFKDNTNVRLYLVTTEEVKEEFQEFQHVKGTEIPDYVIIGDFRDNWDVNRLNKAFLYVIKHKAILLGTQGNKYFLDVNGEPVIDTGSFVHMIANAANVKPIIFGKPSKEYFLQALKKLNLPSENVIIVGDDIDTDILGAKNAKIRSFLVKTGKGQYFNPSRRSIMPLKVIESFATLIDLL